jgi:hypothetical protein
MMKQLNTNIPQVELIKTEAKLSYVLPKVTELFCADVIEGGGVPEHPAEFPHRRR